MSQLEQVVDRSAQRMLKLAADPQAEYRLPKLYDLASSMLEVAGSMDELDRSHPEFEVACRYMAADYLERDNAATLSVISNLRFKRLEEVLAPEIFELDQESRAELAEHVKKAGGIVDGDRLDALIEYAVWSGAVHMYHAMFMENPAIFLVNRIKDLPLGAGIKTAVKSVEHDPAKGGRLNLHTMERPPLSTLRGPVLRDWQDSLGMGAYYALSMIRRGGPDANKYKVLFALNFRNSEFCDDVHNSIQDYLESDAGRRKGLLLGPAPLKPNMHIGDLFYSKYLQETGRALPNLIDEQVLRYAVARQKMYGKEADKQRSTTSIISSAINTGTRSVEEFGNILAADPIGWRDSAYRKMISSYMHILDGMSLQAPKPDARILPMIEGRIKDKARATQAYMYAVRELLVRSRQAMSQIAVPETGALDKTVEAVEAGQETAFKETIEVFQQEYPELAPIASALIAKMSLLILHTPTGMYSALSGLKPEMVQPSALKKEVTFDSTILQAYRLTYDPSGKGGRGIGKPETKLNTQVTNLLEKIKKEFKASNDGSGAIRRLADQVTRWQTDFRKGGMGVEDATAHANELMNQVVNNLGFQGTWGELEAADLKALLDDTVVLGNPEDPSTVFAKYFSTRTHYEKNQSTESDDFYLASSHAAMERLREGHFVKRYEKNEIEAKDWIAKYGRYYGNATDASIKVKEDIRNRSKQFSDRGIEEALQLPSITSLRSPADKKIFLKKLTALFAHYPTVEKLQEALAAQGLGPDEIEPYFVNLSTRFFHVFHDDLILSLANRWDADFTSGKRVSIENMPGERSKEEMEADKLTGQVARGHRFTLKDVEMAEAVPITEARDFIEELADDVPFNKNGVIATYSIAGALRDLYIFEASARSTDLDEENRTRNKTNLQKVIGEREVSPKEKAEDFYKEPMWGFLVTRLNQSLGKKFNNRNRQMLNELFLDQARNKLGNQTIKDFMEQVEVYPDPLRMITGGTSTGVMPGRGRSLAKNPAAAITDIADTYHDALDRAHSAVGPINGSYLEVVDRYAKYFSSRRTVIVAEAPALATLIVPYKKTMNIDSSPFQNPQMLEKLLELMPTIMKTSIELEKKRKEADPDNIVPTDAKEYATSQDIEAVAAVIVNNDNEMRRVFGQAKGIDKDVASALQMYALKLKLEPGFWQTPDVFFDMLFQHISKDTVGYKRAFSIPLSSLQDQIAHVKSQVKAASKKADVVKAVTKMNYVIQPTAGYTELITVGTLIVENGPPTGFSKEDALNRISITFDKIDEWNKMFSELPQPDVTLAEAVINYARTQGFATAMDMAKSPETERIVEEGVAYKDGIDNGYDVEDPEGVRQHVIEMKKTTEFFETVAEMMNTVGNHNYLALLPIKTKLEARRAEFVKLEQDIRNIADEDDSWRKNVELSVTRLAKLDSTGPYPIDDVQEKILDQEEDAPTDADPTPDFSDRELDIVELQRLSSELLGEAGSDDLERKFLESNGDIDDYKAYITNLQAIVTPLIDAEMAHFEKVVDEDLQPQIDQFTILLEYLRGQPTHEGLAIFDYDSALNAVKDLTTKGFPMGQATSQLVKSAPEQPVAPSGEAVPTQVRSRTDIIQAVRDTAREIAEDLGASMVTQIATEEGISAEEQRIALTNYRVVFDGLAKLPDEAFKAPDGILEQFLSSFVSFSGQIGLDNVLVNFGKDVATSYLQGMIAAGIDVATLMKNVVGHDYENTEQGDELPFVDETDVEEVPFADEMDVQEDNGDRLLNLVESSVFADSALSLEKIVAKDLAAYIQKRKHVKSTGAADSVTRAFDSLIANPAKEHIKDFFSAKNVRQMKAMIDAAYSVAKEASRSYRLSVKSDSDWYTF